MAFREQKMIDPAIVRGQIEALQRAFPEIWDQGDEQLLANTLEGQTDLFEMLDRIVGHIQMFEHAALGDKMLLAALKKRAERLTHRGEQLRELVLKLMLDARLKNALLRNATLSVANGPRKVIIPDEAALPERYFRVKREPNKIAIKEHIDEGIDVPGAHLSNAEPVLRIS